MIAVACERLVGPDSSLSGSRGDTRVFETGWSCQAGSEPLLLLRNTDNKLSEPPYAVNHLFCVPLASCQC